MTREEAQAVIMNEQKCIDRADRCNRDCGNCDLVMDEKIINEAYNFAIKALEQPERKTGKWICIDNGDGFPDWLCSECGKSGRGDYSYCPWCNADMREGQDG